MLGEMVWSKSKLKGTQNHAYDSWLENSKQSLQFPWLFNGAYISTKLECNLTVILFKSIVEMCIF